MSKRSFSFDKPLALLIAILVIAGALIFSSAAFGLLARGATHMSSVVFNHAVLGIGLGLVALVIGAAIDHRFWRRFAPYIYGLALVGTAAVFIPGVGMTLGGSTSWINIFGTSFQPSEALKIATIMMSAAYFAGIKTKIGTWTYGFGGFLALIAGPVLLLLLQPDMGTLAIIVASILALYIAAGAEWKHIAVFFCMCLMALGALAVMRPYVMDRIMTFVNPSTNQQDESYQIKQSLIAVGSGGLVGRGFGQGIQKFTYLPEPMGDSIFAVASEELGFIGSVTIVLLFLSFSFRGLTVAARAVDPFGALLATGLATYLGFEAFYNIAAMLGLAPLTGIPLTFMSQGGTAMLAALAAAGILLSVSRRVHKQ